MFIVVQSVFTMKGLDSALGISYYFRGFLLKILLVDPKNVRERIIKETCYG